MKWVTPQAVEMIREEVIRILLVVLMVSATAIRVARPSFLLFTV
ncbi:hypothetical protein SAMN02745219_02089 [Desulfofundulus thermosubterraneus DSM 16057]|uniref:Uncharacterized protein n=1 Tax=Desulfofundulus thermosubterraneus DSM 16057 TaxID=1121432 RepID=A0A1M6HR94_9FIRM|nr:hypothetical protein SAMN02745219_02089 [Desulfofundulus thermosubterraneus DSM 16057]